MREHPERFDYYDIREPRELKGSEKEAFDRRAAEIQKILAQADKARNDKDAPSRS
ncbi:hypothetical protein MishRS11D_25340 [Methylomagnum ishizawai]|nr:hypothetical protein MishRS11D_25340 [Methylomagnum ishizawai]